MFILRESEGKMSRNVEKMASIDAQLRLLAPGKVSEDDKLVEYDALLLDRFLDILQDLHGEDIRETVSSFLILSVYDCFLLLCSGFMMFSRMRFCCLTGKDYYFTNSPPIKSLTF